MKLEKIISKLEEIKKIANNIRIDEQTALIKVQMEISVLIINLKNERDGLTARQ